MTDAEILTTLKNSLKVPSDITEELYNFMCKDEQFLTHKIIQFQEQEKFHANG